MAPFFKLRTAKTAHPQMREIAIPLLMEFQKKIPEIFSGFNIEYTK
jgi:thymidylate synthase (FAD)